ncbi:MAG TPA: nickel-dependent lactate racemase [Syntrophomonadaceae bacterium]|nr:nickel-dependent lactate racemase [Syntrophomonadaceae bacterium]
MMKVNLSYGDQQLELNVPDQHLLGVVKPPAPAMIGDNDQMVREALCKPIGTPTLKEIAQSKQARNAVIVVNDITRPTPYASILPPLLKELETAGITRENITLVVALGIHRPHSREENIRIFGSEICENYRIENHDCDGEMKSLGVLSNGMELLINRQVAEADLLITTGVVSLHYFAGYSGGRKSILPGVAARALIEANHQLMDDHRACLGNYMDNPVSDIMVEASRKAGVDFIINVVIAGKNQIVFAAAGDLYQAWLEAVKSCESFNVVPIPRKADIVIASCGGYPKDINVYQAQKALDAASLAVNDGGIIILVAECREGLGEETFARWIESATCPQDIVERFHHHFELGGHKAYAICRTLQKVDILLYSGLPPATTESMFIGPVADIEQALRDAIKRYGPQSTIWILPEAPKIAVRVVESA